MEKIIKYFGTLGTVFLILLLNCPYVFGALERATPVPSDGWVFKSSYWRDEFNNFYNNRDTYCEGFSISSGTIESIFDTTATGSTVTGDIKDNVSGSITGTIMVSGTISDSTIQSSILNPYNYYIYNHLNSATTHSVANGDFVYIDSSNNSGGLTYADSVTHATDLNGATSIAIQGNYAFVTNYDDDSVTSIDISDPTNLIYVNSVTHADLNGATSIAIQGNYAFVANSVDNSVTSIDISDPTNLIYVNSVTHADLAWATSIAIQGNYAFVTSSADDSVTSIDISDPTNLTYIDSVTHAIDLNGAMDIAIQGNYAFVASSLHDSVTSIDISDPANLIYIDSVAHADLAWAKGIAIQGNYAFVANNVDDSVTSIKLSPFTLTLPASPTFYDYFGYSTDNSVTSGPMYIDPNGKKINGSTNSIYNYYTADTSYLFTYINESSGWVSVGHGTK